MTVSSTTTRVQYNGDGATATFDVTFKFLSNDDITVIHADSSGTETTWTEGTEYTLTGAGEETGGTLTVSTSPTDYTPASVETLTIKRAVAEKQETDLPTGGPFPANSVEQMVDRLTMMVQAHSEEIARALVFAETSSTTGKTVPEPSDGTVLGWSGTSLTNFTPNTDAYITLSAFGATLIDDANAAAARETLGLGSVALLSSIALSNMADAAKEFSIPFIAGKGADMTGEDVAVQTYMEYEVIVPFSLIDDGGTAGTAPTGQAAILDITKNGTTVFSAKPQFAAAATSLTGGTLKTDGTEDFAAGDTIAFKVTQIGSGAAGQAFDYVLKARMT